MAKCIASYSQRRLGGGKAVLSVNTAAQDYCSGPSLLTRESTSVLTVGVSYGGQVFKRRLVHGVAETIMA